MKWHDDYLNVVSLGDWLISELAGDAQITEVDHLQYFYCKPWKWQTEWELFAAHANLDPVTGNRVTS